MEMSHANVLVAFLLLSCMPKSANSDEFVITADVIYGRKSGMALTYDVIQNANSNSGNGAAVLFMVSAGWFSGWSSPHGYVSSEAPKGFGHFRRLVKEGYVLVLVRHGSAPAFKVPDAVHDVRLALRHFRLHSNKYGVDPERIGVTGGSAGGHLALMLGTAPLANEHKDNSANPNSLKTNRVAAVVSYYAPVDIRKYVGPSKQFPALDFDKEQADEVSPILFVSSDDAPTLLIHGGKDWLVTPDNSESIYQAFQREGVSSKLIVYDNVGHAFSGEEAEKASDALVAWFDKYLARGASCATEKK